MKITFEDHSYIEIVKSTNGKIIVSIVARESPESLTTIASSVELTIEQFNDLIKI
jgi:hypothetical protein